MWGWGKNMEKARPAEPALPAQTFELQLMGSQGCCGVQRLGTLYTGTPSISRERNIPGPLQRCL